ncbi:ABC transporter ATP-binding protein [Kumtagia ephedrae]|uniref:Iron ABC transporter substrate-binding protein n=1 Tax=Kumtagia ephedrae TaxID=2116701 RepID=A0A2P7RZB5_9HYPH|nr:ATP-binding cassette domain-containing protein [Mesorhizobium ephedrae]PSJ55551.1 iron ABC transporter substrate-binding protein [Mesorhizobium ephedrae]
MIPASSNEPLYRIDGVSFAVGGRAILQPLDLTLERSRIYALVGPNGSGKSSLIKLLARQQARSGGVIRLLGRDIAGFGEREFARTVAYMPQFTPPAEAMTVRELVALGRFPWHGTLGRFGDEDHAKVEEALRQTDLQNFAERLVDSLSGGERQRAWLAMMLAQDTRCLLLDEPTSALDIAHQAEILALVRELAGKRGITVMVVLHDVNMAARYCDEIIALTGGRVFARGAPAEIVRPDVLAAVYGVAMGTSPHPRTGEPLAYLI